MGRDRSRNPPPTLHNIFEFINDIIDAFEDAGGQVPNSGGGDQKILRIVQRIETALEGIDRRLEHLEVLMAEQTVRLDKLDAATTKLATVLQELRDSAVNGMTPAETARFDSAISTLEAMGKDPAEPLPEVPVV